MSSPTHKNLNSLIESNDSPIYQVGNGNITQTRIYHAKFTVCQSNILYEGTAGTGAQAGYQIQSCQAAHIGNEQGRLTYVWEAVGSGSGGTLPPDEVSVSPENLSPRLETHRRFEPLTGITVTVDGETYPIRAAVENAARAQSATQRAQWIEVLNGTPVAALAINLLEKLEAGREAYYLAALRYVWVTHSWTTPTMYRGGWRQSPLGPLASYFVSDIDWLRESDDLQYASGIWRLTRSWLGGPQGHWDQELYQ